MASHTEDFAQFHARRNAERAAEIKVTWRKVSADTGGGWSGLGPNGQLVFVVRDVVGYRYGDVHQTTRPWRRTAVGNAPTLAKAKAAAAELFKTPEPQTRPTHEAAPAAEGGTTMEATATTITADDLAGDGIEAVRAGKAPYARMRANGKTLAYADDRKEGVRLSVATKAVEKAPKRFEKALGNGGSRRTMNVDAKNVKTAVALLAWLAKQAA